MNRNDSCSETGAIFASLPEETTPASDRHLGGSSEANGFTLAEMEAAVSAVTIFDLYVSMEQAGWLSNPLLPSKKRERALQASSTVPATGETPPSGRREQDRSETSLELSDVFRSQLLSFGCLLDELDRQQWRIRQFGDWYRTWKEPELPYLAAYGHTGLFDEALADDSTKEDESAVEQAYSSYDDEAMIDANEDASVRARARRHRPRRLPYWVVEIGPSRSNCSSRKRLSSWPALTQPPSRFPTHWSNNDKASGIDLEKNTDRPRRAYYVGPGKLDSDAAAVRANVFIPTEVCLYYYEMTVISAGAEGFIGLGLCAGDVALERLPGWEKNSIGYHGDDGHIFRDSGVGSAYGPTYTTGDTVGCCWNCVTGEVFFTKEGARLKRAFRNVRPTGSRRSLEISQGNRSASSSTSSSASGGSGGPNTMPSTTTTTAHPWMSGHEGWYPVIGMRTVGEILEANFGQKPFLFDIEAYVEEEVERFLNSIVTSQVVDDPAADGIASLDETLSIEAAVLDYLLTEGYVETATAFARTVYPECFDDRDDNTTCISTMPEKGVSEPQRREQLAEALKDAKLRASILKCIQKGDLDQANELGREYYPSLFGPSASVFEQVSQADDATLDRQLAVVLFQCQRFTEMLHRLQEQPYQDYEALQYAYERLWPLLEENMNDPDLDFWGNRLLSVISSGPGSSLHQTLNRNRAQGYGFVSRQGVREDEYRRLIRLFILHHLVLLANADSRTLSTDWLQKRRALVARALNRAMLLERPCRARPAGASQDAASYLVRMMQHLNTVMGAEVEHGAGYMALVQAKHLL